MMGSKAYLAVLSLLGLLISGCSSTPVAYYRDSRLAVGPKRGAIRSATVLTFRTANAEDQTINTRVARALVYTMPNYTQIDKVVNGLAEPWGPAFQPWFERAYPAPAYRSRAVQEALKRGGTDSLLVVRMRQADYATSVDIVRVERNAGMPHSRQAIGSMAYYQPIYDVQWYDASGNLLWSAVGETYIPNNGVGYKIYNAMGDVTIYDILGYNLGYVLAGTFPDEAEETVPPDTPERRAEWASFGKRFKGE